MTRAKEESQRTKQEQDDNETSEKISVSTRRGEKVSTAAENKSESDHQPEDGIKNAIKIEEDLEIIEQPGRKHKKPLNKQLSTITLDDDSDSHN